MTLEIEAITLREVVLPLREPFTISTGSVSTRRILLVEMRAAGETSLGECVADDDMGYSSETVDTCWLAIERRLAPRLLGTRLDGPEAVGALLSRGVRGHLMAKAALEMPVWNLQARLSGRSLADRLGGRREFVRTGISIGIQSSPGCLAERARRAVADGYARVKVKIDRDHDIDWIAAARAAVGPDVDLSADANGAYDLADVERLRQLDRFALSMIEQPLAHDDLVRHALLAREISTPICLDESITDVEKVKDMHRLGAAQIVNIKPGRVGGLGSAIAIHDWCRERGIAVWCGGMLESGIGRAYNVALAALDGFTLPGDLSPSRRYWDRDLVTPEWTMGPSGDVAVPRRSPGLGVEADMARIERLCVRRVDFAG